MSNTAPVRFPRMGLAELEELSREFLEMLESERKIALDPNNFKELRKWTGPEVAQRLGGLSVDTLYRRLKKDPSLPQGEIVSPRRREFTLEDIHTLQTEFGVRPRRRPGDKTVVIVICSFKGGVAKTTNAIDISQGLCLDGYNGVLLDLDPQGSATLREGVSPMVVENKDTILPLLEGPGSDSDPNPDWTGSLMNCIRSTHWHGLDLVPSSLALFGGDFAIASRAVKQNGFPFHRVLAEGLEDIKQSGKYDYIIIDTAPSLGFLNTTALYAADVLLIPVPPAPLDVHSTGMFFQTLAQTIEPLDAVESEPKVFEAVAMLISKFKTGDDAHSDLADRLRERFKHLILKNHMVQSAAVEKLGLLELTPYEAETYEGSRRTLLRVLEHIDAINREIGDLIQTIWERRRSDLLLQGGSGTS